METHTKNPGAPVNPSPVEDVVWVVTYEEWGATLSSPRTREKFSTREEAEAFAAQEPGASLTRERAASRGKRWGYWDNRRFYRGIRTSPSPERERWTKMVTNEVTR